MQVHDKATTHSEAKENRLTAPSEDCVTAVADRLRSRDERNPDLYDTTRFINSYRDEVQGSSIPNERRVNFSEASEIMGAITRIGRFLDISIPNTRDTATAIDDRRSVAADRCLSTQPFRTRGGGRENIVTPKLFPLGLCHARRDDEKN